MKQLPLVVVVGLLLAPTLATAENALPPKSQTTDVQGSVPINRVDISNALSEFSQQNAEVTKTLAGVIHGLEEASKATIDTKKLDVTTFRSQLVELGILLQPGSPLLEKIDNFDSALNAQKSDFQRLGPSMGDDKWFKEQLAAFDKDLGAVATSRTRIKEYSAKLDTILKELSKAETRAAFLMLRKTHNSAIADLMQSLKKIGELLDQAGAIIRDVGIPPAQTSLNLPRRAT